MDSIDRQLILNSLRAAADEMAISLFRSSHTMVVREHLDFSTALFDINGDLVVQGTCLAIQLGTLPLAMRAVLDAFPDGLNPDDVVVTNDPYSGGVPHVPDTVTVAPLCVGELCLGYAAVLAHKLDMGGSSAGGLSPTSVEVFDEGLRIPPVKLIERGEQNEVLQKIIATNVRFPVEVLGDLRGQLAALHIGQVGVRQCADRFGVDALVTGMAEILDYTERVALAELQKLPRRRAAFSDFLDDDGAGGEPVALTASIELKADKIVIDYTNLPDQVESAINATFCNAYSVALFAARAMLGEDVLVNAGLERLLDVRTREGSIAHAVFPAAVGSRGVVVHRLWDVLLGAMTEILPRGSTSAGAGGYDILVFAGRTESGAPYVLPELLSGSWGAREDADGSIGVSHPVANMSNTPVEYLEAEYPILVREYSIVPDSGGAGTYRGGNALRRSFLLRSEAATLQLRRARWRFQPWGREGGESGAPSSTTIVRASGEVSELPGSGHFSLARGDVVVHTVCGAGGFGPADGRDSDLVRRDLEDGYVSRSPVSSAVDR